MRFREHRGTLLDSLKTEVELKDRAELIAHLQKLWPNLPIEDQLIEIHKWAFDQRIQQQLYIVTHKTQPGVLGFTYE